MPPGRLRRRQLDGFGNGFRPRQAGSQQPGQESKQATVFMGFPFGLGGFADRIQQRAGRTEIRAPRAVESQRGRQQRQPGQNASAGQPAACQRNAENGSCQSAASPRPAIMDKTTATSSP
jgi:hypothetical protein